MSWVELLMAFIVAHLVGDFLFQTDWQAAHKHGGLGHDRVARRALFAHVGVYTACFLPVFVWIALDTGDLPLTAAAVALVFLPHLIQDDGRVVRAWMLDVKHTDPAAHRGISIMVDQTMHVVSLTILAVLLAVATA